MMDIRELAYELYKIDWMRRISADRQMDSLRDYYREAKEDEKIAAELAEEFGSPENSGDSGGYSYDDYIFESGYDGEIYVCYDEFLDNEYMDKKYMKRLLGKDLYSEYLEDLKSIA